jgi:hypothetical protein
LFQDGKINKKIERENKLEQKKKAFFTFFFGLVLKQL